MPALRALLPTWQAETASSPQASLSNCDLTAQQLPKLESAPSGSLSILPAPQGNPGMAGVSEGVQGARRLPLPARERLSRTARSVAYRVTIHRTLMCLQPGCESSAIARCNPLPPCTDSSFTGPQLPNRPGAGRTRGSFHHLAAVIALLRVGHAWANEDGADNRDSRYQCSHGSLHGRYARPFLPACMNLS